MTGGWVENHGCNPHDVGTPGCQEPIPTMTGDGWNTETRLPNVQHLPTCPMDDRNGPCLGPGFDQRRRVISNRKMEDLTKRMRQDAFDELGMGQN